MKRKIFLLSVGMILVMVFVQCNKCGKPKNLGTVDFISTDLSIVPYSGTEKIVFKDSVGYSLYFYSGYRKFGEYEKDHIFEYYYGECEPDYYYIRNNVTHFEQANNYGYLELELLVYYYDNAFHKLFYLQIQYTDSQDWVFDSRFAFNDLSVLMGIHADNVSFSDSLFVGPNKYYNVYTLTSNNNIKTAYYNTSQGLLGFKTDEGLLWYLKN